MSKLRDICSYALTDLGDDYKIGGPGVIVEMDETQVAKKPKYHVGDARNEVCLY